MSVSDCPFRSLSADAPSARPPLTSEMLTPPASTPARRNTGFAAGNEWPRAIVVGAPLRRIRAVGSPPAFAPPPETVPKSGPEPELVFAGTGAGAGAGGGGGGGAGAGAFAGEDGVLPSSDTSWTNGSFARKRLRDASLSEVTTAVADGDAAVVGVGVEVDVDVVAAAAAGADGPFISFRNFGPWIARRPSRSTPPTASAIFCFFAFALAF